MGITILMGGAALTVIKWINYNQEISRNNNFEAYAKNLGDAISAQFYRLYWDVQTFSQISSQSDIANATILTKTNQNNITRWNRFAEMYGVYDLILLVDVHGRLISANSKSPDGKPINTLPLYQKNFAGTPWFKAVMDENFTEDKSKGFQGTYVEEIHIDPWTSQVYGSNRLGNSFSAAVRNDKNQIIGVLSNRAGSRWLEMAFRERYSDLKRSGYPSSILSLIGSQGNLLYRYSQTIQSGTYEEDRPDWQNLLKINLIASGSESAKLLPTSGDGVMIETDPLSQKVSVSGFNQINNSNFIKKLGWGVIVSDNLKEAGASLRQSEFSFYLVLIVVLLLTGVASFLFSNTLAGSLSHIAEQLTKSSTEVLSAAKSITQSSTELSEAVTEQASAIQQTAASIEQVNAMVKKSADNAFQSQKVSETSRQAAELGQAAVQEMIQAINDITHSNASIMDQVTDGNRKISEIIKVISEIESKTNVINDIVFQTKLLSFNASVEAARAGEHGKGFAVVAEEVGNLAQMSGAAAKEISSMLDSSIQKVQGIVNDTKSKVQGLVVEGKAKVEKGTQVATKCGEALANILNAVQEVNSMVGEIASAAQEESQGVLEISKAVHQLDRVTQQNSVVAHDSTTSAHILNSQASDLQQLVADLLNVVQGHSSKESSAEGRLRTYGRSTPMTNKNKPEKEKRTHSEFKNKTRPKLIESKTAERGSNVIHLADRKKSALNQTHQPRIATETQPSLGAIPSKDDPRFGDV